ncbi:FadR/GntR family transcriptional regulator [Brevibacterium marinum]|uniref:DNA-binding FadR family transcriptional regulator n=1 Tax=Brevibacterium marinum TaxID=418643 RepID=A0A846RZ98_9MICO|nr:FCD domain-containing protein [Brevibacterium marinum]NJC56775.1 DNA-binding FadR family transcriptional regulator [Brevibacterium marinum]
MNKAYELVLAGIERSFLDGSLTLGDRLPGERALAERFDVSRSSVREAIRILDAVGLIRAGVGSGPDAGSVIVSEPAAGLSRALKLHVSARHIAPADVLTTRVVLESDAVATAAEAQLRDHATAPSGVGSSGVARSGAGPGGVHLERAGELLKEMCDADISKEAFHSLDARFHRELCAAAGNPVTDIILASLSSSILDYVSAAAETTGDWPSVRSELTRQHAGLLEAVLAGDSERARRGCAAHIRWFAATTGIVTADISADAAIAGTDATPDGVTAGTDAAPDGVDVADARP